MQRSDVLLGEFESVVSVHRWDDGELVRLTGNEAGPLLAYVPAAEEAGRSARETMALVAGSGIPECRRTIRAGSGATAIVLEGAEDARPLCLVHDLPAATLRAGLTSLLRTLVRVHSLGIVHGGIDRTTVLADASGRFWLVGWAGARPVSDTPRAPGSLTEATEDLRDLACAFREALLRRPWPDPQAATIHDRLPRMHAGQDLIDAGVKVDRDFARVLSRLVGCDPRETYSGAMDVLVDLSVEDATAFDPWESLPVLGTRREITRVLRLLDDTQRATSETVQHASSVEYVGPGGSGKSRLLAEIARAARARNVIVLTAEGGSRGTWGGVGALARQLVQLLGRDARMCRQHEEVLRHLLDDHDPAARPQPVPAPGLGIEGRNTMTASCTAALTDMVRIAFRSAPGLLLLDDEEHLPAAARDVWRASGQFVQAVNGGGGVLHALFVSASTRPYPAEVGAHRVSVEMRTWRQRDLEKFLAHVFASPGGTRDVSVAIHRITGGRPGEVIGYLRDLESRGMLRREGLRWRLEVPLAALPALTGGAAEQVRRALDSCSRDATALVEVLAVASDVTLGRSAVAEISDVRGPRLAAASESAAAAGLVVPDGSAWRIRTDAIAHKVHAAIADDRRKVLHREVLQLLLDTTPDAIHPIARHARASADPRAAAWTEQAISRAREEGEWGQALAHLEHAQSCATESFDQSRWELIRADLLFRAGRLLDAMAGARRLIEATLRNESECGAAQLLLGRACYEGRQWDEVVEVPVHDHGGADDVRAEIRYLRAAAFRHLSLTRSASREARLAAAEMQSRPSLSVRLAMLEYEFQEALYNHDFALARERIVQKLRLDRQSGDRDKFVADLAKYINVIRHVDVHAIHNVVSRAVLLTRGTRAVADTTKHRLCMTLGMHAFHRGDTRKALRYGTRALHHAQQSGSSQLVTLARVSRIFRALCKGGANVDDREYILSMGSHVAEHSTAMVASIAFDLAYCLAYYARQDDLEALASRVERDLEGGTRFELVTGMAVVGRLWLRLGIGEACDPASNTGALSQHLAARLDDPDMGACVPGYMLQLSGWECKDSPADWSGESLVSASEQRTATGWGAAYLALSLALWAPIPEDLGQWTRLISVIRTFQEPLPIALEWQRHLAEAVEARRLGDWRELENRRLAAIRQVNLLADTRLGALANEGHRSWVAMLREHYPELVVGTPLSPSKTRGGAQATPPTLGSIVQAWAESAIEKWRATHSVTFTELHARELDLLADALLELLKHDVEVWGCGNKAPRERGSAARWIVLRNPCTWTAERMWEVHRMLEPQMDATVRIAMLLPCSLVEFRLHGAAARALASLMGRRCVSHPAILDDPQVRVQLFLVFLTEARRGMNCSAVALDRIQSYKWPSGVAEMESVVRSLSSLPSSEVEIEHLDGLAWPTHVCPEYSHPDPAWGEVLKLAGRASGVQMGEVARVVKRPRRSLLRMLDRMIHAGLISRLAKGRGAKYVTTGSGGKAR